MQTSNNSMSVSDMRARLQQSRQQSANTETAHIPQGQAQFSYPPLSVRREDERAQNLEKAKKQLTHIHHYWHIYAGVGLYCLFQAIMFFPDIFPGTEGLETPYEMGAPILGLLLPVIPSVGLFLILRSLRRQLQNAAKITEAKNWTTVEWAGAAIGFAALFYLIFFHQSTLDQMVAEEFQTGPFELTPREWIMAVVKCIGGAVGGAMLARRFLGGEAQS